MTSRVEVSYRLAPGHQPQGEGLSDTLGYFNGVATDSRTDAWAVGGTNWFSPTSTLIEHWDGTAWS
jgi:hypothetical protein